MALTIREARNRGIDVVHIHCHKHNSASARMIIRNGGALDSEVEDEGSPEVIQRYVVQPP
jgi:predicted acetyltransferase